MLRLLVVCRAAFLVLMSTGSFCVMESQQVTADDLQQQIAVTKSRLESLSESDPNFAILSSRLGSLLYSAGRFTGSTEALQRALDSDKQYRPSNLTDLVVDEVNLARACLQIGDLRKASQLLEDAMNQLTHMSPAPLDMSEPVYALQGSIFESKGDLDSALKAFKLAQDYDEQDHNLTEYANRLNDQARILERRNDFAKAAILLEKARTVLFDNGLKNSYVYPTVIADLGIAYSSLSQYSAAEPLLIEARQLLEGLYGTGSVQEAEVLNALGLLYDDLGRHREAEQLQRSVLTLRVAGYDSDATALAQNNLGKTLILVGKWSEAEELLRQAQQHFQRSSTPTATLMLADVETNLAELYIREAKFSPAEPLLFDVLSVRKRLLAPADPDVALALHNIGELYVELGDLQHALIFLNDAYRAADSAYAGEHVLKAKISAAQANVAYQLGRKDEAMVKAKEAVQIYTNTIGITSDDTINAINTLAAIFVAAGDVNSARTLLSDGYQKISAAPLQQPLVTAGLAHNLAEVLRRLGDIDQAEVLENKALEIKLGVGHQHPSLESSYNTLALIYQKKKDFATAEATFARALELSGRAESLITDRFVILTNMAILKWQLGDIVAARDLYRQSMDEVRALLQREFPFMSERERLVFKASLNDLFPALFSFCSTNVANHHELSWDMLEASGLQKLVVTDSVSAVWAQVRASDDPRIVGLVRQIENDRAALTSGSSTLTEVQKRDLQSRIDREEGAAFQVFSPVGDIFQSFSELVRRNLPTGSAFVDFTKYREFIVQGDNIGRTTNYLYAAVVVTGPTESHIALLGDAHTVEDIGLGDYNALSDVTGGYTGGRGRAAHSIFWKVLEPYLPQHQTGSLTTVFVSPDGVISQVALDILPDEQENTVGDLYTVAVIDSPRDFISPSTQRTQLNAVLIGDPAFDSLPALADDSASSGCSFVPAGKGPLQPLNATLLEVKGIAETLTGSGWTVSSWCGTQATAVRVLKLRHPRLLHLATHGFFKEIDMQTSDLPDAMAGSGLYLAGANLSLRGDNHDSRTFGLLNAYEVASMDLHGTAVVVLSACETGLGTPVIGEGLFGLRRAFHIAGAENVIMSLWPVPNRETTELMLQLYTNLTEGATPRLALAKAKATMRARVKQRYQEDIPFYWGAFVITGP